MAKKVAGSLKLQVAAGKANPSPPVGPALGQRGINIMEFCKAFNAKTQDLEVGSPTPVIITYFTDKSFTMEIKTPPASFLLKKAAGLKSASKTPGKASAGTVTKPTQRCQQGSWRDLLDSARHIAAAPLLAVVFEPRVMSPKPVVVRVVTVK